MPAGDVLKTYADIETTTRDLGFQPTTPISAGVPKFIAWYRQYYGA
jgi:UDP-glucuronate 4-epimerase